MTRLLLLVFIAFTLQRPGFAAAATDVGTDIGIDQHLKAQVPLGLTFLESDRQKVALENLVHQRPSILVLSYYECPNLCTLVLNGLVSTLLEIKALDLGVQYDVITLSINPKETPSLASKKRSLYLNRYGKRGNPLGWHFLTGDKDSIEKLAMTVGFKYRTDPQSQQYLHASGIIILTPGGEVSRYFLGLDYDPRDLELALVEASNGKIGSISDRVALLCYEYNPLTGKYSISITRVLRVLSALTVLALCSLLISQFRSEGRVKI